MVHEIVGRINGHYGTLTHVPIHHLDRQLAFHELCALYAVTDVALVTSLRDGMNLVSYEYVACQSDNAGDPHNCNKEPHLTACMPCDRWCFWPGGHLLSIHPCHTCKAALPPHFSDCSVFHACILF